MSAQHIATYENGATTNAAKEAELIEGWIGLSHAMRKTVFRTLTPNERKALRHAYGVEVFGPVAEVK